MEYSLDGIVALINRKEPLPSGFTKAIKQVKGITDNRGLHKVVFHELCHDLLLKLQEEHYDAATTYVSCDYLYKLMSVLLRHNICIVPLGVARNLSIYSTIYLTPRADLMNDSDIYGLQQVAARKKSSHTNNEIETIIRAKKKIQNYNTLLHVFECLGSAQLAPLDTNQRIVLNAIINDMLLPRDAIRYIKSLFSYACEIGSFQYDFSNPKYVNTVNAAWGQEQALEVMNIIAKTIAPSHLSIAIPDDFPHAKLLKERYDFYCPEVYFELAEPVVQNVVPVNERSLGSLTYSQRRSRLKAQINFAWETLAHNPSDKLIDELNASKDELLLSRPGFSDDFIEHLSFLPPEYGDLKAWFANLQSQLMNDEASRLSLPNFAQCRLAVYSYQPGDQASNSEVAKSNSQYFLDTHGYTKLLGKSNDGVLAKAAESLHLDTFVTEERYRCVQNAKAAIETALDAMTAKDLKDSDNNSALPAALGPNSKHNLANVLGNQDLDPNYQLSQSEEESEGGDDKVIDPKDFAPTLKKMRGRKDKEVNSFVALSGAARDDLFHVVPFTFEKFNFLLHDYLIWSDVPDVVANFPEKATLSLKEDYSRNLSQFIYKPFKQVSRLNKILSYEFLLRYLFAEPNARAYLDEQAQDDEAAIERLFEHIVHNNYLLLHGCELSLASYHCLYYFERYLNNPQLHFNNELFYLFLFKKEPYLINLYLARLVACYGPNLINIPRQFYSLLALNMLLFPQKSHVSEGQSILHDMFMHQAPSHNFYKVLLINKLSQELYDEVHKQELADLSLLFMDHEQSHKQSLVYEESFYYDDCKRKLMSALSGEYFEHLCSAKTFDKLLDRLSTTLSGANLKTSWQLQEQELQAIALKFAYDAKMKNPTFSVQYLSHELKVLLSAIYKIATLVQNFGFELSTQDQDTLDALKAAQNAQALSAQELKKQVESLDVNISTELIKSARHISHGKVGKTFSSPEQERSDIYQDYAKRFNLEGDMVSRWEDMPEGYKLSVQDKLTPSSLIKRDFEQGMDASLLVTDVDESETWLGQSALQSMLEDASEELVQDIRMLQGLLEHTDMSNAFELKERLDSKNLTLSDLDDKITKVNFSFLVYAYHKMIALVASNLQRLQENHNANFYQEQVLNSYFKLELQDKFGKGTSFYDEFSNNLYKGYIVPVVNKLLCSEHQYCYSLSQNIQLWEHMGAIAQQCSALYDQDYALTDLAYNRLMLECLLYSDKPEFVASRRAYVLGVTHTKQLGFVHGITTDYLQEVSSILHNTLQVQMVPYYLPLKGASGANFSLLRPSVSHISVIAIPECLTKLESRSAYDDLLFSLHCANTLLEILNALVPIDLQDTQVVDLLVNEVILLHSLKQQPAACDFVAQFMLGCMQTLKREPALDINKLVDSRFMLLKAVIGSYSTQRLKQMLFLGFGLILGSNFIKLDVKKNFVKVLKNLDMLSRNHKDFLVKVKNDKAGDGRSARPSWKDNLSAGAARSVNGINPALARYSWYRPNQSLKDQSLNLDMAKIKAKLEESEEVQEVITKLRDNEQELLAKETQAALQDSTCDAGALSAENFATDDSHDAAKAAQAVSAQSQEEDSEFLNAKLRQVVESLAIQNSDAIVYLEFNGICVSHGLISGNYCIEALNEYTFEVYDEPLLELDGEGNEAVVYITTDILELIYAQCVALKKG